MKRAKDMADFVRSQIAEIVHDPDTARLLMPHDHPIGSKRICVDTEYYETYNRDNVTLVDVRTAPIAEITPTGLRTRDAMYELDAIVFATGFDAMTGSLFNLNIHGKPRIFMPYVGGVGNYRKKCQEVADKGYEGFAFAL
jgi:cyclohexanone monooxygenase